MAPQEFFAQQCQMNKIARDLHISIIDMQLKTWLNRMGLTRGTGRGMEMQDPLTV